MIVLGKNTTVVCHCLLLVVGMVSAWTRTIKEAMYIRVNDLSLSCLKYFGKSIKTPFSNLALHINFAKSDLCFTQHFSF